MRASRPASVCLGQGRPTREIAGALPWRTTMPAPKDPRETPERSHVRSDAHTNIVQNGDSARPRFKSARITARKPATYRLALHPTSTASGCRLLSKNAGYPAIVRDLDVNRWTLFDDLESLPHWWIWARLVLAVISLVGAYWQLSSSAMMPNWLLRLELSSLLRRYRFRMLDWLERDPLERLAFITLTFGMAVMMGSVLGRLAGFVVRLSNADRLRPPDS